MTEPGSSGPDLGPGALAALMERPGFDDAMMAVARLVVAEYRVSWLMNRILSDRGRLVASFMALDFHFADPERRGFTLEQLRNEAVRGGFASRGRITAWAGSMRLLGLFAAGSPGRPQRLVPTPKFLAMFRARLENIWRSITPIHPRAGEAILALVDERFVAGLAAALMVPYRTEQRLFDAIPELVEIAEREAGMVVLMSVMLKHMAGEAITIAGLAGEFTISRAHVRSILQAATGQGLLVQALGGFYQVLPALGDALRRFFAALFQVHIFAIDRALARVGG